MMRHFHKIRFIEFGGFLNGVKSAASKYNDSAGPLPNQLIINNALFKSMPNAVNIYERYLVVYVDLAGDSVILDKARQLIAQYASDSPIDAFDAEWVRINKCAGAADNIDACSIDDSTLRRLRTDCFSETLKIMFFCIGEYFKRQFPRVSSSNNYAFNNYICSNTPFFIVYDRSYLDDFLRQSTLEQQQCRADQLDSTTLVDTISSNVVDKLVRVVADGTLYQPASVATSQSPLPFPVSIYEVRADNYDDNAYETFLLEPKHHLFVVTRIRVSGLADTVFATNVDENIAFTYKIKTPGSSSYLLSNYDWLGPAFVPSEEEDVAMLVPEMFFVNGDMSFSYEINKDTRLSAATLNRLVRVDIFDNDNDEMPPATIVVAFGLTNNLKTIERLKRTYFDQ